MSRNPYARQLRKPQYFQRIVRDTRDAKRDYWVTREQLQDMLDNNELDIVDAIHASDEISYITRRVR